jgi:hypothetical protein
MLGDLQNRENKIQTEESEVPGILSKEIVFADGYKKSNAEENSFGEGETRLEKLPEDKQKKLEELTRALEIAREAYDQKNHELEGTLKKIKKILWLKNLEEKPDNAKQSLELQRYQKAQEELEDFEGYLHKEDEERRIKEIAGIFGADEISNLILDLKKADREKFIELFGKVFFQIAKSIFVERKVGSLKELMEMNAEKCMDNSKIQKLMEYCRNNLESYAFEPEKKENMEQWIRRVLVELMKSCGAQYK